MATAAVVRRVGRVYFIPSRLGRRGVGEHPPRGERTATSRAWT
jgi:hypothetical protein